jgi:hypothetical protein
MSEQQQSFHVGDMGSNPIGDASSYADSPESPTPVQPQKLERPAFESERRALKEARLRCGSPINKDYADYGGRGIRVCDEWLGQTGFAAFLAHIGPKPTPAHTLDRIDNARGYEPGNVRWSTRTEQANNRRSSKLVTWRGETLTAAEWSRRIGCRRQDVANQVNRGRPLERLVKPVAKVQP